MTRNRGTWTTVLALITVAAIASGAAAQCSEKTTATAQATAGDIVDTAVAAGKFGTLVTAVKAAGLVDALKAEGPLTVFAPTDEAFSKLPKGTLQALLNDPPKLRAILKYHVISGKVGSAEVVKLTSAKTLLGQNVRINAAQGVKVNAASVIQADIACKNGVIHVIDTVLMPEDDIVDVAAKASSFKTLLTALEAADLTDTLRGEGPFTVFAPTDEAFAKLPKQTLDKLLKDPAKLGKILTYHVVPGKVLAADVVKLREAKTVQGGVLKIAAGAEVKVNEAKVLTTDVAASNGVIHVIDTVLLPE